MKVLQFPSAYRKGERPYDIFKDRMAAISSIVGGIKDIIANKYINKQNAMIAENIQTAIDEQKAIDLSNLILSDPPDEIYPANLEDTIGQFYDKFAMGPMMQKEIMTGGLPAPGDMARTGVPSGVIPTGTLPGVTPTVAPTTEAMIPKMDMYQLYNAVKDLPTGQISWDNIYKKMTEKKPWFMGATGPEKYVLDQMMGQVTDPRTKLVSDINLAKLVEEAFYKEEKRPGKYPYTREEVLEYEALKAAGKPDIKSILENIPEGFEISSFNVSTTGTTSFSFKPIDKTTPWEFDTWDEAVAFRDTHPQEGFVAKIETHGEGFDLTWYQKGAIDTLKPPTYGVAENIRKGFKERVENMGDFTNELNRLKGLGIDTSTFETTEYFVGLMEEKYAEAIEVIQYCMRGMQSGEETDEDGLNYRDTYKEWWEKLRNYDEQYFMVIGERLLKGE